MDQLGFLKGTGVALVTPFKENGAIDFAGLEKLINHCIDGGVEYLVSMGTTGESSTLSEEEKWEVVNYTKMINGGRVPLVVGIGGNNTASLVKELQRFNPEGISAVLSSSPAYNKPSQQGIYQHYMQLAKYSPLPIIIYNVPGRTASNISAEVTLRLARDSDKFAAIKEASGDLAQATAILKDKPASFCVLSGDDPLALALIGIGGVGVISVIANALPRPFSDMIRCALQGDFVTARQLNNRLFDIHKWLYIEGNPVGIKAALKYYNICENYLRLPLVPMSDHNQRKLYDALSKLN